MRHIDPNFTSDFEAAVLCHCVLVVIVLFIAFAFAFALFCQPRVHHPLKSVCVHGPAAYAPVYSVIYVGYWRVCDKRDGFVDV